MKLNMTDYVLELAFDGDSPEEEILNLEQTMEELVEEMYLVEDFI